jgi:hypothetical protein
MPPEKNYCYTTNDLLCTTYRVVAGLSPSTDLCSNEAREACSHRMWGLRADRSRSDRHFETERDKSLQVKRLNHLHKEGTSPYELGLRNLQSSGYVHIVVLHVDDTLARGSLCGLRPRSTASRTTCCHGTAHDRHEGHEDELSRYCAGLDSICRPQKLQCYLGMLCTRDHHT